jgi:integrase
MTRFNDRLDLARQELVASGQSNVAPRRRPMTLPQMARTHYAEELVRDTEQRERSTGNSGDLEGFNALFRAGHMKALGRVASGLAPDEEMAAVIGWAVEEFNERANTDTNPGTAEWRRLARALASVTREALKRTIERDEGDDTGSPALSILSEPAAETAPVAGAEARIMGEESLKPLSALLPLMHAEKRIRPSTKHEQTIAVRMFEEHLGEALPVYKISRRAVLGYKNALLKTPTLYSQRFPGLSLPEAIEANGKRKEPFPTLNPKTINDKWLAHLGAVFNWLSNNEIIPDNPAQRVKVDGGNNDEARKLPFTPGDLAKIAAHPTFAERPLTERAWSVLMALYTGLRASEIAQLELDGVRHERGVLVVSTGGELKNEGSRRLVPVHSDLTALGFDECVATLRSEGKRYLFPEWHARGQALIKSAATKGRAINQPYSLVHPKWFNRFLLPGLGIAERAKTFHSLRHTFKTALAVAGVTRDLSDALTGHKDATAGGAYIHEVSIDAMKDAIERLRFDGFTLLSGEAAS